MLVRDLKNCEEFIAGDNCLFRELLHPDKQDVKIRYSLGQAIVKPGNITQLHKLKTSEVYYILEGEGLMYINEELEQVHIGQAIYIPPSAKQYIKNIGKSDLKFLCLVDPAWHKEDEEAISEIKN